MNDHLSDETIAELCAGELDGEARRGAEAHIADCADCARALARARIFREQLAVFEPAPNPAFVSGVMSRLHAAGVGEREPGWFQKVREWLAPSAAVVVGALLLVSSRNIQMQSQVLYPDEAYIMGVDEPGDDFDVVFGNQDI